jgi:endonuclease/exonuclease/phosphatase family metal-dependent hydrolase
MIVRYLSVVFVLVVTFSGCNDSLIEYPNTSFDEMPDGSDVRIVSYNIHGGKGPNGEGGFESNLVEFKGLLMGEQVLCFQEVEPECWSALKSIFSDYPYRFYLSQRSTKFGTNKQGGNAIFSKLPIVDYDAQLINTDPGGDKWERKAQYVRLFVGGDANHIHLFHYHNTYNWHHDNSAGEKEGYIRFLNWVESRDVIENEASLLIGDFNLSRNQCLLFLPEKFSYRSSNWVDHIFVTFPILDDGIYNTVERSLSDHQAVWSVVCNEDC